MKIIVMFLKEFGLSYQLKPQTGDLIGNSDADYTMTEHQGFKHGAAIIWSKPTK